MATYISHGHSEKKGQPCVYEVYLNTTGYSYLNTSEPTNCYELYFPDNITIPAGSMVDVDMKIKINLLSPNLGPIKGMTLLARNNIKNTPLILVSSEIQHQGTVDYTAQLLKVPLRNISAVDYNITAGDNLLCLMVKQYFPFHVYVVNPEHAMINSTN